MMKQILVILVGAFNWLKRHKEQKIENAKYKARRLRDRFRDKYGI